MKRFLAVLLICLLLLIVGCSKKATVKKTYNNGYKTYYEMSNGTWMYGDRIYKYRLEINGRMPNAAKDSTFVYLSNIEEIPFERAYMAAGLSSNTNDYFSPEEAMLVEMN